MHIPLWILVWMLPYAGTTTTCESLYMGAPCVTMAGSLHAHNVGVSLLGKVGLGRLIAKNEDEYVQLALQLASDVTALANLRMSVWELMAKSPVCDGQNFTLGLESTYRDMWQRYCTGHVPSLKRMEMLQQQAVPLEPPIMANGFNTALSSIVHLAAEENGTQSNENTILGKLS